MIRALVGWAGLIASGPAALAAQDDSTKTDSLRIYQLSEVTITAPRLAEPVEVHTSVRIAPQTITIQAPRHMGDVTRLIPGAHLQTNSRGETLVYLRAAGERQVSVFLDGALLNFPWDNRVDLSMVPAAVVQGMTVAQGVPPIEYGANALGGVVNLTSRLTAAGGGVRARAVAGTAGRREGSLAHHGRLGAFLYEAEAGYSEIRGWPLPGGADLPFSQSGTGLRTNTDARITNAFVRGVYFAGSSTRLGGSLLVVDAAKGVAPEGHVDPDSARVRFWRYPDWRTVLGVLNGEGDLDDRTAWKAAAWVSSLHQRIVSYESAAYDATDERQDGDGLTVGARTTLRRAIGTAAVKVAVNGLTSTHRQLDVPLQTDGSVVGTLPDALTFRQHVLSGGVEYEMRPLRDLRITVGGGIDAMFAPLTGDKPGVDPFVDYSLMGGLWHDLDAQWHLRVSLGRKTRFPTMRELFGEALDRFLLNPDLEPESAVLGELALGYAGAHVSGEIIPFINVTSNTIDQRNVTPPGETRPLRQRINLEGSYVIGLQVEGVAQPAEPVTLDGSVTLTRPRRRTVRPTESEYLAEKPEALARMGVTYKTPFGMSAMVEGQYRGRAYSPNERNEFVELPTSLLVNARVGQEFTTGDTRIEVFARGDNLTDETVLPQLGLPGPGRSFAVGAEMGL